MTVTPCGGRRGSRASISEYQNFEGLLGVGFHPDRLSENNSSDDRQDDKDSAWLNRWKGRRK